MSESKKGKPQKKKLADELAKIEKLRMNRAASPEPGLAGYADLKTRVQDKVAARLDPALASREAVETAYNAVLAEEQIVLALAERKRLF